MVDERGASVIVGLWPLKNAHIGLELRIENELAEVTTKYSVRDMREITHRGQQVRGRTEPPPPLLRSLSGRYSKDDEFFTRW